MRILTARQKAAIRSRVCRTAVFVYIDHPDGDIYAWSGLTDIDHGGQTWRGLGAVAAVTGVQSASEIAIYDVNFVLSAVDAAFLAGISSSVRGRQAQTWLAILGDDGQPIGGLIEMADSVLDTQNYPLGDDGMAAIQITGQSGFWFLERPPGAKWSAEEQKRVFAGDTGFDTMAAMVRRDVAWLPE